MAGNIFRYSLLLATVWGSSRGSFLRHDMGHGGYGEEKWKKHTEESLGKVTRVPGDFDTLHEAVEAVLRIPKESFRAQRTLLALGEGSFLMP